MRRPCLPLSVLPPVLLTLVPGCGGPPAAAEIQRVPIERANVDVGSPGRALLIGVGRFASPDVTPLEGPREDVAMIEALLRDRFGFAPAKIRTLIDEQATRESVMAELEALVKPEPGAGTGLGEDELFVFYFSGHGSQSPDGDADELDGKDETLLMYDSRAGGFDLSDDDLGYMLGSIPRRQALIILDACHTGSGTRGTLVTRSYPAGGRVVKRGDGSSAPSEAGRLETLDIDTTHVLLAAAADDQYACEAQINGRAHGVFTFALHQALAVSDPEMTLQEFVLGSLQSEIRDLRERLNLAELANPQVEAPRDAWFEPLLRQDTARAKRPWARAEPLAGGGVRVVDGVHLGGEEGSVWTLHREGELDFGPESAVAVAACTAVDGMDSLLDSASLSSEAPRAVRVAEPPRRPVPVHFADDGARAALGAELEPALGAAGRLSETLEPGGWEVATNADGGLDVRGADARAIAIVDTAEDLLGLVRRRAIVDALNALETRAGALRPRMEIATTRYLVDGLDRGQRVPLTSDLPRYRLSDAQADDSEPPSLENSIMLELRLAAACHVTLIYVDESGVAQVLFPNARSEEAGYLVDGFVDLPLVRIPDSIATANEAGFHLSIGPPIGMNTVVAVACDDGDWTNRLRTLVSESGEDSERLLDELARKRLELIANIGPDGASAVSLEASAVTFAIVP